jgi:hypothetical protein
VFRRRKVAAGCWSNCDRQLPVWVSHATTAT